MAKLKKEQLEKKKKYHEKRAVFYAKKLKEAKKNKIGFKWYN